ncbi:MAG: molybdenum cofactor biosynthesis protein MoaE [Tateyamaria sp.]|uniref:molybdenum cofactor biosynthesis protein MoaE n=1 Tax=Tateyamaria sp. TaxID=1929288 RepID=UPI0032A0F4AD
MRIVVQEAPFDLGAEAALFAKGCTESGAIVTFTGIVRDVAGGLETMEIEHYPGMTEAALAGIAQEAMTRWALEDALVIHRHGALASHEMIMMVATAAPHRKDAFEAAEFLMDYLKSRAPFWKREVTSQGAEWVAAKDADEDALKRW